VRDKNRGERKKRKNKGKNKKNKKKRKEKKKKKGVTVVDFLIILFCHVIFLVFHVSFLSAT
jgi:hypothetical protein